MIELISEPSKISAQWLTEVLRTAGLLGEGCVLEASWKLIGTGKMGDNARFTLKYDGDYDAPLTLIAKLPATDETARMMAGAMGAYRKEVMFYRELAQQTSMKTPAIYLTLISEDGTDFIILMEDMAPAEPGDQLQGETLEHARQALAEAAKLHAAFYDKRELLQGDHVSRTDAEGAAFGQELLVQNWPGFVDRFGHGLSEECIAFGDDYVVNHCNWMAGYSGPKTLVHGDFSGSLSFCSKFFGLVTRCTQILVHLERCGRSILIDQWVCCQPRLECRLEFGPESSPYESNDLSISSFGGLIEPDSEVLDIDSEMCVCKVRHPNRFSSGSSGFRIGFCLHASPTGRLIGTPSRGNCCQSENRRRQHLDPAFRWIDMSEGLDGIVEAGKVGRFLRTTRDGISIFAHRWFLRDRTRRQKGPSPTAAQRCYPTRISPHPPRNMPLAAAGSARTGCRMPAATTRLSGSLRAMRKNR